MIFKAQTSFVFPKQTTVHVLRVFLIFFYIKIFTNKTLQNFNEIHKTYFFLSSVDAANN